MKQKGLGRGLDAIFGTEPVVQKIKPMSDMAQIEVSLIRPNPTQPRVTFDQEALTELSDSIRSLGIIQPLTLKREGSGYIIISGERRWRAAQEAGLATVPAYIREVDDTTLHAMALVENIQREELNPIEIALSMRRLIEECDLTQDALSEKVGMKRPTISNYMRLLKLPDPVQFALKNGVISMGHAKAIAGVESPKRQISLLKKCVDKAISVRQAEEMARALQQKDEQPKEVVETVEEEYPESYLRLVEQLETLFSQNIAIKRAKSGGGKIVIEFGNDEEIETFIKSFEQRIR